MADDKIGDTLDKEAASRAKNISAINTNAFRRQMKSAKKAQTLEVTEAYGTIKGANQAVSSIDRVLKNLGSATEAMATGVKLITAETARGIRHVGVGSAKAMGEYARAVGDDININKQAFLAITLGRISPILGYSVAKMMETTVFKNMIEKMKEGIGKSLSSVALKFRKIASMGWEKATGFISSVRDFFSSKRGAVKLKEKKKVPQAQEGGYVKKGGLARVHAAEIITPKKDFLGIKKLVSAIKIGFQEMRERNRLIEERMSPDIQKNILVDAYKEATDRGVKPQGLMVKYLIRIAEAVSQWTVFATYMQSLYRKFPFYRYVTSTFKAIESTFASPFRFMFKSRGKVKLKGRTILEDFGTLMGGIYDILFSDMDRIARNTNDTANLLVAIAHAQGITKATRSNDKDLRRTWTIAGYMLRGAGAFVGGALQRTIGREKRDEEGNIIETRGRSLTRVLTKKRYGLREFAFGKRRYARPWEEMDEPEFYEGGREKLRKPGGWDPKVMEGIYDAARKTASYTRKANEQREGMFTQSRRQTIATETTTKTMGKVGQRLKKARTSLWKWALMAVAFYTSTILPAITGAYAAVKGLYLAGKAAYVVRILPILTKLLPLLGPLGALAGGVAIGTLVNKYLIKPLVDKYYSKMDKRRTESMAKSTGSMSKALKVVREYQTGKGGTADEALKAQTGLQTVGKLPQIKGREKSLGVILKRGLPIIQSEQENFVFENINEYLKYGSQQINQLREKWIQEGNIPKMTNASGYEDYGRKREAAFLKYLKSKGTIIEKAQLMKKAGLKENVLSKAHEERARSTQKTIMDYSNIIASFTGSTAIGLGAGLTTKYLQNNPDKLVKVATKILTLKRDKVDPITLAAAQAIVKQKESLVGITKEKLAIIGAKKDLLKTDLTGWMVEGMKGVKEAVVDTGAKGAGVLMASFDNSVRAVSSVTGGGTGVGSNQTGPGGISFYTDPITAILTGNFN